MVITRAIPSWRLKVKGSVAHCVWLCTTPWTVACQTPLSMEFSRQEYWSGLPFPSPGDLPHPGIKPRSPALQEDSLPSEPPGKPLGSWVINIFNWRNHFTFLHKSDSDLPVQLPFLYRNPFHISQRCQFNHCSETPSQSHSWVDC